MQIQWWGYHELLRTLKPYHMLKNLFEIIAIKDDGDGKTLGTSTCTQVLGLMLMPTASVCDCAHEPLGKTLTT